MQLFPSQWWRGFPMICFSSTLIFMYVASVHNQCTVSPQILFPVQTHKFKFLTIFKFRKSKIQTLITIIILPSIQLSSQTPCSFHALYLITHQICLFFLRITIWFYPQLSIHLYSHTGQTMVISHWDSQSTHPIYSYQNDLSSSKINQFLDLNL